MNAAKFDRPVLLVGLAFALVLCLGPIFNPDLGWHLAAGDWIVAHRAVPRADFLTWTMAGKPWMDFEWGSQLLFHALEKTGGLMALWVFKSLAFGGLMLLLAAILQQWGLPGLWIGLALPPFSIALFPMSDIRPEVFSHLFFLVQLLVLERRRLGLRMPSARATLAAHAAVYALWANLHAGFPTGLALCGVYGAAEAVKRRARPGADGPVAWAAAGALGTLCNPYGPALYGIFWEHWRTRGILKRLVIEWEAPNFFNGFMSGYWALVAFSFAGFIAAVAQGVDVPYEHLAAVAAFGLLASRAFRTTAYMALVVYPLSLTAWRAVRAPAWWPRARPWALGTLALVCALRTVHIYYEQDFRLPFPIFSQYGPSGAVAVLEREKATLGSLHLYNPWNWGGYLARTVYPDYPLFMDGRYIFTDMQKEIEDAGDRPPTWKALLDRRGVDLALIYNDGRMARPGMATDWRPFITYAYPRTEWALVYWDFESILLVRRSKVPAAWLKTREYKLLRPHDSRYLGLLLTTGAVTQKEVRAEIDRYEREIDDPLEVAKLKYWLGEYRKGMDRTRRAAAALTARSR